MTDTIRIPLSAFPDHLRLHLRAETRDDGIVEFQVPDIGLAPVVGVYSSHRRPYGIRLRRDAEGRFHMPVSYVDLNGGDDGTKAIVSTICHSHDLNEKTYKMATAFARADDGLWIRCPEPAWCLAVTPANFKMPLNAHLTVEADPGKAWDVAPSRTCRMYFRLDRVAVAGAIAGLFRKDRPERLTQVEVFRPDLLSFGDWEATCRLTLPAARVLIHRCLPFMAHDGIMLWNEFRKAGVGDLETIRRMSASLAPQMRRVTAPGRTNRRWIDRGATWMEALAAYSTAYGAL